MMRTKKNPLPIVLSLFILGFLFLSGNQNAAAAQVEYKANWAIHVDFNGNQVNADLTVEVWEFTDGEETNHLERTRPLPCRVRNGVAIDNNEATFSGGRGILCKVPSRRVIVYNMTRGEYIPPNRCDVEKGALAASDIGLDANDTGEPRTNTIFALPDLALVTDMPPSSTFDTMMRFSVDNQVAVSGLFNANQNPNSLLADFNQVNDPDGGDLAYQPIFVANGTVYPSNPAQIDEDLSLSMAKSRLFIGYSPQTGTGLFGSMTSLDIDPGCVGTG